MKTSILLPTITEFKILARKLRDQMLRSGSRINHSKSLELIAKQWGFRDWNTLCASADTSDQTPPLARNFPTDCPVLIGQSVRGKYLGVDFSATILGIQSQMDGHYRLSLHCDQPIDVVKFESFSSLRRRLHCTVDHKGRSVEKTSDGVAQMILDI